MYRRRIGFMGCVSLNTCRDIASSYTNAAFWVMSRSSLLAVVGGRYCGSPLRMLRLCRIVAVEAYPLERCLESFWVCAQLDGVVEIYLCAFLLA